MKPRATDLEFNAVRRRPAYLLFSASVLNWAGFCCDHHRGNAGGQSLERINHAGRVAAGGRRPGSGTGRQPVRMAQRPLWAADDSAERPACVSFGSDTGTRGVDGKELLAAGGRGDAGGSRRRRGPSVPIHRRWTGRVGAEGMGLGSGGLGGYPRLPGWGQPGGLGRSVGREWVGDTLRGSLPGRHPRLPAVLVAPLDGASARPFSGGGDPPVGFSRQADGRVSPWDCLWCKSPCWCCCRPRRQWCW